MLDLGAEVHPVNFSTVFCQCNRTTGGCRHTAAGVARELGLRLTSLNVTEEYLEIARHPRYGRGSSFNPCVDCRIFMLSKARRFMEQISAEVVFTGEVIGQRPMSQTRKVMAIIEQESGLKGRLLRPLCARLFPPTIPEREGHIDRRRLLGLSGRSRKPQIELARGFGMEEIPCSGGGCLLTDRRFGARMFDLLAHNQLDIPNVLLAKVGRHFRLSEVAKAVVGRNKAENQKIVTLARPGDRLLELADFSGPTTLLRGQTDHPHLLQAAALTRRYGDAEDGQPVTVTVTEPEGETTLLSLDGLSAAEILSTRI
jgi:tRNA U34 2-thiouridine synthase MnmA/TrmU